MTATTFLERLRAAVNAHDVDRIVACFSPDYVNETPCHPAMGFRGTGQVRRNWEAILAGVPDLRAEVLSSATYCPDVWTEWEMQGTRRDGAEHLMRGVVVFTVRDDVASAARFYLEPVVDLAPDAEAAVGRLLGQRP